MKVSAAIMAHPARAAHVAELQAQLDRDVPVIWDVDKPPSPDPRRRWRVGKRAWQAHDPDADWHLVLQDDAIVCADLLTGLEKALELIGPTGLVSPYTGTGRPDQLNVKRALAYAHAKGHAWIATRSLNWGVAITAPVPTITRMVAWCSRPRHADWNYDYRVGVYYRDVRRWRTQYTVPSLVEHRDTPSLVGHGNGPTRRAHQFLGLGVSALSVDWTAHPEPLTPTHHQPAARRGNDQAHQTKRV